MKQILLLLFAALLLIDAGCKKKDGSTPQATGARQQQMEREKQDYTDRTQKKLDEANRRIAELEARKKEASGSRRTDIQVQIDDLKKKELNLRENLDRIKSAGLEAWDDLKPRLKGALDDLTQGLTKAISQFRFSGPTSAPSR
jgi:chromosome segregation ATPase